MSKHTPRWNALALRRAPAFAWTAANASGQLQQVRQKRPNAWGFYDLHGLVWEWTRDYFAPYLLYPEPILDPVAAIDSGRGRVARIA